MFRRNLIPVWIGIILLSGMFLMGQESECPWNEGVYFPDPNLEAGIRDRIGKPEGTICASDLEGITSLILDNMGISDLTGLEYCTGLNGLYLEDNQISHLSPWLG